MSLAPPPFSGSEVMHLRAIGKVIAPNRNDATQAKAFSVASYMLQDAHRELEHQDAQDDTTTDSRMNEDEVRHLMLFGKLIQQRREQQAMTRDELAAMAQIDHATLFKIETGRKCTVNVVTFLLIARVLDMRLEYTPRFGFRTVCDGVNYPLTDGSR